MVIPTFVLNNFSVQLEDKIIKILKSHFNKSIPIHMAFHKVLKLDSGTSYFLAMFLDQATKKNVAAIIDSQDFKIQQTAELGKALDLEIPDTIKKLKSKGDSEIQLVWKPSKLSFSPFYPFWEVKKGSRKYYIDKNGHQFEEIALGRG